MVEMSLIIMLQNLCIILLHSAYLVLSNCVFLIGNNDLQGGLVCECVTDNTTLSLAHALSTVEGLLLGYTLT